ncbi:3-hydroxy-9,10-secoandrosta-1,3,5(10)-triene-9,17-dione monooxygenase [Bacillus sp. OV166]|uniref:acyl-CoA dehydrogenase family protein n=1 Tax=Bacillus sp. OV166 TaxID=1882763 RepID=UPI000A2AD98E|nr:acyl-CoA dehydrogenase family protein [Bacillus sp. OV166]SMQ64360.1 3-hydroxy-9,10-secoandrosta-1,3,5(10)-triene-9,17-dione monooxygenase [Bacillus sp. OV166]
MASFVLKGEDVIVEDLLAGAERIGKLAEQEALEAEKNATISQNVVNLIKETQISRMMLPKKYGGPQADLKTFAKVVRKVANYNISAAWLTYLYPLHNMLPAFLPENGADEIIHQGGLICDIFAALGKAERDGDGYRISGKWSFVSGVNYSDWVGVGVMIQFPDSEQPVYCLPMLKTSEVEVVHNWDTFGLRGSGSNQIIADQVYVPMERILRLDQAELTRRPPLEEYDTDYPFYHVPFFPSFYLGFGYMALGGAERILKEFKVLTEKRVRLMDGVRESESPRSQRVLAEMTTDFHVAEALLEKYINLLENYETDGCKTPPSEFFAIRTKAIKICTDIAVRSLLTLGGGALYKGGPMELFLRDIIAVATHKTSLYEDSVAAYGQELFGFNSGVRG